jgi:threonine/homoserine/homoserine lactone efflux protein
VSDGVIAPLVALGLGVAASPVAAIAAILLVASPGGRAKGGAFVAGWAGGLVVLGGAVVALEGAIGIGSGDGSSRLVAIGSIALGGILLAYGLLRWLRRPGPGDDDPSPKWMAAFDSISAPRAFVTGAVLAAAKPKNLVLTLAAGTAIAEQGLAAPAAAAALAAYVLVASATALVPVLVAVAMGERAGPVLAGWRAWLTAHNAAIMTVVLVAFGAILVWRGATGLA